MSTDVLLSPSAVPVTRSDYLRVQIYNNTPATTYAVYLRYLIQTPAGKIVDGYEQLTVPYNTLPANFLFKLTDGYLLSVTISSAYAALQNGQLYTTTYIQRSDLNDPAYLIPILTGYITGTASLQYPRDTSNATNSGRPAYIQRSIPNPVGGQTCNVAEPAFSISKLMWLTYRIDTDATVANRNWRIDFLNGTGIILSLLGSAVIPASQVRTIQSWNRSTPPTPPTNYTYQLLPEIGWVDSLSISIAITNVQATDVLSEVNIGLQQYFYNPT